MLAAMPTPSKLPEASSARSWWSVAVVGLALFHLCGLTAGDASRLWLPGLGLGIGLYAWLGWRILPWLAADLLLGALQESRPWLQIVVDTALLTAQIPLSWWIYHQLARGSRWLDDPRSATVFLILVPGALSVLGALLQASAWFLLQDQDAGFLLLVGALWLSRALGTLAIVPTLLVFVAPLLMRRGWLAPDASARSWIGGPLRTWTWDEILETAGLCLCSAVLAFLLVWVHRPGHASADWALWGLCLMFIVWTSMRQGLRGGCLAASLSAIVALSFADVVHVTSSLFSPLQGNLLAQGSTALLVGAAAGWIRTTEARYRHIVGHIPVVLYSARLPRPVGRPVPRTGMKKDSKAELYPGPLMSDEAEVMLVSPACRQIFGSAPEALLGPYANWLARIVPEDRELVIAALTQLCLQRQPVTCEYRLNQPEAAVRWVRDTLAPSYSADGMLEGWEGVIEDITEQRALALHVRRTTGMLQALVANLPTGVYFVQGPLGHPLLVNARARQLLGQREDQSAGLQYLSEQYRLYRRDGTLYPADELPVSKALRLGVACMANDIIVHRPDGRMIPLITWAAPIDMNNTGKPDAAVWVLEDLSPLYQAEAARRESEQRLRGIFEAMGEGVLVQGANGAVLECNPAACAILGDSRERLIERRSFAGTAECLKPDGQPYPSEELPDRVVLERGTPVRALVLGLRPAQGGEVRWLLINAMPLPVGPAFGFNHQKARIVTTFADITSSRRLEHELQNAQRLELVGRLASGTVHDFNNLLTVMIGVADIVRLSLPTDHTAQPDLERLIEAGEQAAHLAGQLLTFSRQRAPTPHVFDLNDTVRQTLRLLRGVFARGIHVEMVLSDQPVRVRGEESQLKQVLMNLCLNAREAMPQGGRLSVRTGVSERGEVLLSIQDNGLGMSEEVRRHIFEPFYSTKERGTGLGLVVVQQIVSEMGGQIEVQSALATGTCVEICFKSPQRAPVLAEQAV
jgi:PAS domain S-box-containing protein